MIKASVKAGREALEMMTSGKAVNIAQIVEQSIRFEVDKFRGNAVVNDDTTMQVLVKLGS